MRLEGTVRNGVIVLDPGGPPLADGTRVEVAPRTGMEPLIRKTPGVIGGDACVGNRRIAVWMLVEARNVGITDEQLLTDYDPPLTRAELALRIHAAVSAHPDLSGVLIRIVKPNIPPPQVP